MKKILINVLLLFVFCNLYSQQIIDIDDEPNGLAPNTYYKDVNNVLNKYEGTWIYTNGNTTLKIILQKRTYVYSTEYNNYIDFLVGEYQYIENGVELINTLPLLNNTSTSIYEHNINGNLILFRNPNVNCVECEVVSIKLDVKFIDPDRDYLNSRCRLDFIDSTPDKMNFILQGETSALPYHGAPNTFRVPKGNYTLIKQ